MRKASDTGADEMRPEYKRSDFGTLVRGKYAQRLRESSNVVVIESDLAKAFPSARAVNAALRLGGFGGAMRGKPAARYRKGIIIVMIDPDVSAAFPNAEAVNKGLRKILDAAPTRPSKSRRS